MQLPIVGRIGVIVYVTVGDAAPQIEMFGPEVITLNGQRVPALRVHNAGNAHTRMSGFLSGKDASGQEVRLHALGFPDSAWRGARGIPDALHQRQPEPDTLLPGNGTGHAGVG